MQYRHPGFSTAVAGVSLAAAMFAGACSSDSTTTPSPATTTTTPAPAPCAFALAFTSANANGGGDTITVNVGASAATCTWTAVSNASFITIKSGASGTGNGSVVLTIAANPGSSARSGTVTVAGQTLTISQPGGLVASFQMFDPATQPGPTTECRFTSLSVPGRPSTCTLRSTSFTFDATAIVSYSWNIQYTYGSVKTITGTGSTIDITDTCGQVQATDDGATNPLSVSLTITDAKGNTATATAGSGSQPAMQVRLYNCGV
jgi:hypothetical protein